MWNPTLQPQIQKIKMLPKGMQHPTGPNPAYHSLWEQPAGTACLWEPVGSCPPMHLGTLEVFFFHVFAVAVPLLHGSAWFGDV